MSLQLTIGQHSIAGRKEVNQDFHGAYLADEPQRSSKGIAVALADGISSSAVSQEAAQAAVASFLEDYYCTSEAWSVKKSGVHVLDATNAWLHAQTRQSQHRFDRERGYVCTFSAVVVKSQTAHVFHVGDARIDWVHAGVWTTLTEAHRVWVSSQQSHLARALGMDSEVVIDYRAVQLQAGDLLVLSTDGVHEWVDEATLRMVLDAEPDLDAAARAIVAEALQRGSPDNLTIQLVRIDALPDPQKQELYAQVRALPCPPLLAPRSHFEGYQIVRELKGGARSHVYLAVDEASGDTVVIKAPAIDLQDNPAALERFLHEDWIARRINNVHVLKAFAHARVRRSIYTVTEYVQGQTLAQWITDHPNPDLATVRAIVTQIARGLQAFHRLEMVHQDLKPDNIMIDAHGTVKIIDFGATRVAGVDEIEQPQAQANLLGAALYAAPEYFLGEAGTARSDIYSLAVITYQMLNGGFPYGTEVAKTHTRSAQNKLNYTSVLHPARAIPSWVDDSLRRALHPDPWQRYAELTELVADLHQPNPEFIRKSRPPLIERHPVGFWQGLSLLLAVLVLVLLALLASGGTSAV